MRLPYSPIISILNQAYKEALKRYPKTVAKETVKVQLLAGANFLFREWAKTVKDE